VLSALLARLPRDQPAVTALGPFAERARFRCGKRRFGNRIWNARQDGACGERCQKAAAVDVAHFSSR
jgi:hypothetical protein